MASTINAEPPPAPNASRSTARGRYVVDRDRLLAGVTIKVRSGRRCSATSIGETGNQTPDLGEIIARLDAANRIALANTDAVLHLSALVQRVIDDRQEGFRLARRDSSLSPFSNALRR